MTSARLALSTWMLVGLIGGCADDEVAQAMPGEREAAACYGCHGGIDRATGRNYPNLKGLDRNYLIESMRDYAEKRRSSPIMHSFVSGLSEPQRHVIANFYSELDR